MTPNASKMLIQIYEYIAFELLESIYASEQLLNLQNQKSTHQRIRNKVKNQRKRKKSQIQKQPTVLIRRRKIKMTLSVVKLLRIHRAK